MFISFEITKYAEYNARGMKNYLILVTYHGELLASTMIKTVSYNKIITEI